MKIGHTLIGSGPFKVLVMHDWLGDSRRYEPLWPLLDQSLFTFSFMDFRGHGKSCHINGDYTLEETLWDAEHLVVDLGWETFDLVAHSLSTLVAQKMLLTESLRKKVNSCILISPVGPKGLTVEERGMLGLKNILEGHFHSLKGKKIGLSLPFGKRFPEDLFNLWPERGLCPDGEVLHPRAFKGHLLLFMRSLLGLDKNTFSTQIPISLLVGEREEGIFHPAHVQESFSEFYQDIFMHIIPGVGHYPMLESPQYLMQLLERQLLSHRIPAS